MLGTSSGSAESTLKDKPNVHDCFTIYNPPADQGTEEELFQPVPGPPTQA